MESPIRGDWESCRVGMEVRRNGPEDLGEIIETKMGMNEEA